MRKSSPRVAVEGACANGHRVQTEAARGRTTWEGTCPHEGCDLAVIARRIPSTRTEGTEPAPATTTTTGSGVRVHRVRRYADDGHGPSFRGPERSEPELRGAGSDDAGVPAADDDEGQGEQLVEDLDDDGQPPEHQRIDPVIPDGPAPRASRSLRRSKRSSSPRDPAGRRSGDLIPGIFG